MKELIESDTIIDTWRLEHDTKRNYTFCRTDFAARLDYWLVNDYAFFFNRKE